MDSTLPGQRGVHALAHVVWAHRRERGESGADLPSAS